MVNSLNVLIVDDNDDDALLVAYAFGEAGFDLRWSHVDTASALVDAPAPSAWTSATPDNRPATGSQTISEPAREGFRSSSLGSGARRNPKSRRDG